MPDNEIKTIKIGNKEFDKNEFGNFINNHLDDYLRYAKDKGGFSQDQANLLRDEIYKAYNSNDDFDVTGYSLTNPNNFKNIEVTQNRFLRRDKKIEQGLTGKDSWLAHFIAKAGQTMNPYEKPENSSKWNRSKHDLGAYFRGNNQDAERIFESMDREGQNTEGASRKFAERDEYLFKHLLNHQKQIQNLGFTFNENDDIYDDNYANTLQELIDLYSEKDTEGKFITDEQGNRKFNKSGNFNRSDILSKLQSLGAVGEGKYDYIRAFTSDQYEYLTEEEKAKIAADKEAAEAKRKKDEEEAAAKVAADLKQNQQNFYNTQKKNWFNEMSQNSTFSNKYVSFQPVIYPDKYDNFIDYYIGENISKNNNNILIDNDNEWNNSFKSLMDAINNGDINKYSGNIDKKYLMPYALETNFNAFEDLGDNKFLMRSTFSSKNNGWGLIYDRKNNDLYWEFLGDSKYASNQNLVNNLKIIFNDYIKSKYTTDPNNSDENLTYDKYYDPDLFSVDYQGAFKHGGNLIKKYQYGEAVNPINFEYTNKTSEKTKERAEKNNRTVSEQEELDRPFEYVFNGNDITQLITIGANLGSMFMGPISGALVGAGATATDFINDIDRDGFQWRDAKNLVTGLGMDAIGMIPVVGDSFGTMGKVTRSLVQYVPKIIGYIGTAGSLANTPEVINSLKKVGNEKLTVQDWKNIADAVNLIVTGARGTKNTIYSARAKQASLSKPTDGDNFKLQIEISNKNNKKDKKLLILEGEDARKAQRDPTQKNINEILKQDKYKNLEGYEAVPESTLSGVKIRAPWKKIDDPLGSDKKIRAGFSGIVDYETPSVKIQPYYDPVKFARNYSNRQKDIKQLMYLEPNHGHDGKNVYDYSQVGIWRRNQKNKLIKQENKLLNDLYSPRKFKSQLKYTKQDLLLSKMDNYIYKLDSKDYSKKLSKAKKQYELQKQKDKIELNNLYDSKRNIDEQLKLTEDSDTRMDLIEKKSKISEKIYILENKSYQDYENTISHIESNLNTLKQKLKDNNNRIHNLYSDKKQLRYSLNHPKKYYEEILNLKKEAINPEGDKEVFKSQYFDNYKAIKRYFNSLKKGGSIDRNKLNKFLNYGKR